MKLHPLTAALSLGAITASAFAEDPAPRPKVIYTPIVLTGQSAPGGGTFLSFPYHSFINDADQVVFLGDTRDSSWGQGIYLAGPTGLSLVAHANQPAPGYAPGVVIEGFDINYHRANNVGQVSFEATLAGPGLTRPGDDDSNAWGNWLWSPTQLQKIAQWRTPAPGTGPGVNYRTFSRTTLNDLGQVAYAADLIGPNVNPNNDTAFFGHPRQHPTAGP